MTNLGAEDVWLKCCIQIGIIHRVYNIQPDDLQVDFKGVTSSEEQISIREKSDQVGDIPDDVIDELSIPVGLLGLDCTPDQRVRLMKVLWKQLQSIHQLC